MAKTKVYSEERRRLYGQVFKKGADGRFYIDLENALITAFGLPNNVSKT